MRTGMVEQQFKKGEKLTLQGYTSTSRDINVALKFAFTDCRETETPIVYKIHFETYKFHFDLNQLSAYPEEEEVLIQDGLAYAITKIENKTENGQEYTEISLKYPPDL